MKGEKDTGKKITDKKAENGEKKTNQENARTQSIIDKQTSSRSKVKTK